LNAIAAGSWCAIGIASIVVVGIAVVAGFVGGENSVAAGSQCTIEIATITAHRIAIVASFAGRLNAIATCR
jgi:hypothetical protein